MDWHEICVKTDPEAIEAVADLFHRLGSGGVVIEDPEELRKIAQSGVWDAFELPEESLHNARPQVKGYLPDNEELPRKMEELEFGLSEIMTRLDKEPCDLTSRLVREDDWANSWKAYFKPLKISDRLVVCPSWEKYQKGPGELVITLDPGMAFGTGSHATTSMCARFLEKYLSAGDKVIDVGTGSGILSISAALLGAGEVLALDYDDVAVKVAEENVQLNMLQDKITVRRNDLLQGVTQKANLIVANIIADVIIRLFPQVGERLLPGGFFITSGIIGEREEDVVKAAGDCGFVLLDKLFREDWLAQVWQVKEK